MMNMNENGNNVIHMNVNAPEVRRVDRPFIGLPLPGNKCFEVQQQIGNIVRLLTAPGDLALEQKEELQRRGRDLLPQYINCKLRRRLVGGEYNVDDLKELFRPDPHRARGGGKSRKQRRTTRRRGTSRKRY